VGKGLFTDVRAPVVVGAFAALVTAILFPVSHHQFAASSSFIPALLSAFLCFDVMSIFLLVGGYLDNGDLRLLAMAWAYIWSVVVMTGYALAFPGVLNHSPLASTPSVAPWLYIGWHAGFPILLGVAWAPWPRWVHVTTAPLRRRRVSAGLVTVVVRFARDLPVLIHGLDTTEMTRVTAPFVLPLVVVALVVSYLGLRERTGPERWSTATILVCLCDLLLTYHSHYRFSLGWYVGRSLAALASGLFLVAMLAQFSRLRSAAERQADTDPLTGIANRRGLESILVNELARADRTHVPTCVLSLDLDGFKGVNDRYGHAGGDRLLQSTVLAWSAVLRTGDVLARTGGDEFVALLVNTDDAAADVVIDRLVGATPQGVGVSVGKAVALGTSDIAALLAAADSDMYDIKARRRPGAPVST
jgi:diguanylate cyclase (GGDEF)-like protein